MQLTNGRIRIMIDAIQSLMNTKVSGQAAIDLIANVRMLRQSQVDVEEAQRAILMAIPGFAAYDEQRIALCVQFAARLPTGQPMVRGGNFVMAPQSREAFSRELAALEEQHAEVVVARDARLPEVNALLELTVDLPLRIIARGDIVGPIEPRVIDVLWDIIDTSEEKDQ